MWSVYTFRYRYSHPDEWEKVKNSILTEFASLVGYPLQIEENPKKFEFNTITFSLKLNETDYIMFAHWYQPFREKSQQQVRI